MKKARITIAFLVFLSVSSWAAIGIAADFPQKPIRMIIVYAAGGGTDVLCRAFQPAFEKILGQRILIENIPAGGTKVGTMELMKAKPDGYTLVFMSTQSWVGAYYAKTYDTKVWEQVVPIGNVTIEPLGFVEARTESPYKTWADLVKAAKASPGKLTCGGPGRGMTETMHGIITKSVGINTPYVPFAGAGPSKIALLGGHIDFRVCQPPEAITMIRAGKTRGLAISTDKRMAALPDVPTFKELGIGGTYYMDRGIWGPPNLPPDVQNALTKAIEKASKDPEFVKLAQDELLYTVKYKPPQQMREELRNFDKEFGPMLEEMYKEDSKPKPGLK
jgi:tripartite-type tricarboxylate transporter receptor subunit TctC